MFLYTAKYRLKELARRLNVTNKVIFIPNAPGSIVRNVVGQSKMIMHTNKEETFGISVVKGMAAGCVPLVYKDWGLWLDIVEKAKYGLGFGAVDEITEKIDDVFFAHERFNKLSNIARERSKYFSEDKFRKEVVRSIEA